MYIKKLSQHSKRQSHSQSFEQWDTVHKLQTLQCLGVKCQHRVREMGFIGFQKKANANSNIVGLQWKLRTKS